VLQEPLDLQDQADRTLAASLLRRLAHYLDADLQAAEPARVLLRYAKEPFETLDPFKAEVMRNTADPSRAWLVLSWVSIQAEEFAIAPVSVVVWASSEANDIALL
jgi:hypothetical protein